MAFLGVNIDHVATLRQARREYDPDPIMAAQICEKAGAKGIVAHLREDRRHIQDRDIYLLRKVVTTKLNLEMSLNPKIVEIAVDVLPDQATLVPERRQEITTEGGLDLLNQMKQVERVVKKLSKNGIAVSVFIDPDKKQVEAAYRLGISMIEFHTGQYAHAFAENNAKQYFNHLKALTVHAQSRGIVVNLGHGLNYDNTYAIAKIPGINELNIGHAIVSRAVFVGLQKAVRDMVAIIKSS